MDETISPNIPRKVVAVHEASHAVAGLCLGRRGMLKRVSIVPNAVMKGGCEWIGPNSGVVPMSERGADKGVRIAGPIGEVMFEPTSFGSFHALFNQTIFQPVDILNRSGRAGWGATDLVHYLITDAHALPTEDYFEAERLIRDLFSRPTVSAAIKALSAGLESAAEIIGPEAQRIVSVHLTPQDYVGLAYIRR